VTAALHAGEPPAGSEPGVTDTGAAKLLEDSDQAQRSLRQLTWLLYAGTAAFGKDSRGRTTADDIDAWVMSASVRAQLKAVRAQAEQLLRSGDESGARSALENGQAALTEQMRRLALIGMYWTSQLALDRHRALWRRWLKDAPEEAARASKGRIGALETRLAGDFSEQMTDTALQSELVQLLSAYNEERSQLAALVSDSQAKAGVTLASLERSLPCPPPPPEDWTRPDSTRPHPAGAVAVDDFYPDSANRARVSGSVILRLTVNAEGCMTHAEVSRSSGAPEIDDAALDVAERMSYYAARENGKPVERTSLIRFTFQMPEHEQLPSQ
jgi:TonB family protein